MTFADMHPYQVIIRVKQGEEEVDYVDGHFSNWRVAARTAAERHGRIEGPNVAMTFEECRRERQRQDAEKNKTKVLV